MPPPDDVTDIYDFICIYFFCSTTNVQSGSHRQTRERLSPPDPHAAHTYNFLNATPSNNPRVAVANLVRPQHNRWTPIHGDLFLQALSNLMQSRRPGHECNDVQRYQNYHPRQDKPQPKPKLNDQDRQKEGNHDGHLSDSTACFGQCDNKTR